MAISSSPMSRSSTRCPPEVLHAISPAGARRRGIGPTPFRDGAGDPESGAATTGRPAAGACVLGLAVALAAAVVRPGADHSGAPRAADAPAHRMLRQVTFDSGLQREPSLSPDGQSVAYVVRAVREFGHLDPDAGGSRPRADHVRVGREDSQPDWSPDGRSLVFRSERDAGGLFVVPARGGAERRIASFGYRPRWSPDGSLVLFSSSGHEGGTPRMYIVGLDGRSPQPLRADMVARIDRDAAAAWKPDDGRLSVWGRRGRDGWTFLTAPVAGGPVVTSVISPDVERRIAAAGLTLGRFRWSRSGRHLFFEGQLSAGPQSVARDRGPEDARVDRRPRTADDGHLRRHRHGGVGRRRASDLHRAARQDPAVVVSLRRHGGTRSPAPGNPVTSGGAGETGRRHAGRRQQARVSDGSRRPQELWERSIIDGRERLLIVERRLGAHATALVSGRAEPRVFAQPRRRRRRRARSRRWRCCRPAAVKSAC